MARTGVGPAEGRNADETSPLLLAVNKDPTSRTAAVGPTLERFWIVGTFFLLAMSQAVSWNAYGPIAPIVQEHYGWSNSTVSWLANTANVGMFAAIPFSSGAVDVFGCRPMTVFCAALMLVCSALRCLPGIVPSALHPSSTGTLAVMMGAMVANGLSAGWLNFAGPVISTAWFPPGQRTTATSILSLAPYVGVSAGFILGPLTVRDAPSLEILYRVDAAVSLAIFIAVALRWPSEPHRPPSATAAVAHDASLHGSVAHGYRTLFLGCSRSSARVWAVAALWSLPAGVFQGWLAVLELNLAQFGFGVADCGWLGCWMNVAGCVAGVLVGMLTDRFAGRLKTAITCFYILGTITFGGFMLTVLGYLPGSTAAVYVWAVMAGVAINGPIPLFFELVTETAFPSIPAAAAAAVMSLFVTFVQVVFLALSFDSHLTGLWMNWLMLFIVPITLIPLLLLRVEYNRLRVDRPHLRPWRYERWGAF